MAQVVILTDDGQEIDRIPVDDRQAGSLTWLRLTGRADQPFGALGRALRDARIVQGNEAA